jgi:hypothetical protein
MGDERGEVTQGTRQAEEVDEKAAHGAEADGGDEGAEAAEDRVVDDDVRSHYREMTELGAQDKGEGRIS